MFPEGGIEIRNFILHSVLPQRKIELPRYPMAGKKVSKNAYKEERMAYWEDRRGFRKTPVLDQGKLKPRNVIDGPAIVECKDTNVVLEPGSKITVDKYLNLIIEKTS
jgi:N-methylhydantoinase A/oxoprolinase/acetone carboxylase beta subunit